MANRLEKLVVDLETGQRGFVITHEPRFLAPWGLARRTAPVVGRELLALADERADHPRWLGSFTQSGRTSGSIRCRCGRCAARRPGCGERRGDSPGKRLVDALRVRFNRYAASERDLLRRVRTRRTRMHSGPLSCERGARGLDRAHRGVRVVFGRAIVLPIRRAAGMAGQIAGGELSARMPETGIGEVGMLEGAFNQMAVSLEENQAELRRHAEQQAALRRVATLVARDVPPEELSTASRAKWRGCWPRNDRTAPLRAGRRSHPARQLDSPGPGVPFPERLTPPAGSLNLRILSTGRPASSEFDENDESEAAALYRRYGLRSTLGVPIFVGGRLWGLMVARVGRRAPRA